METHIVLKICTIRYFNLFLGNGCPTIMESKDFDELTFDDPMGQLL